MLLPDDVSVKYVSINGEDEKFFITTIEKSKYVDFAGKFEDGAKIKIGL